MPETKSIKPLNAIVSVLLLALALFLFRESPESRDAPTPAVDMAEQRSDYYLQTFTIRTLDADGQLTHTLAGDTLTHYPHDDTAKIDTLSVRLTRQSAPDWHIDAERGWLSAGAVQLNLHGAVSMRRGDHDDPQYLRIDTRDMQLDTETGAIATKSAVTMFADTWHGRGTGLRGNTQTGDLALLDDAEFVYATD